MAGRPRKPLPMSDEEIRREFRLAKDPAKQIKILAEENDVSRETIRRIVCEKPAQPPALSGFVPIQDLMEQKKEKEKDNMPEDESIPLRVSAEGELPSEPRTWQPLPAAPATAAADVPAGTDDLGPSSLPDVQDLPDAPARRVEPRFLLTEAQLMELWFILGILRGVLDASAESGKPGETMKDAVDELEILLRSLN